MSTGETVSRLDLLDEKIAWAEKRLLSLADARVPDTADENWLSQLEDFTARTALTEQLEEHRDERARLLHGALHLRLTGPPVSGSAIEAEVVERVLRNVRRLAESHGTEARVGIPMPGSYVVEILPIEQGQLGEPFEALANLLVDALRAGAADHVTQAVLTMTSSAEPGVVQALSRLIAGISNDRLEISATSELRGRSRSASADRVQINELARAFADAERVLEIEVIVGSLVGALEGVGRFEIQVGDEIVVGSIPKDIRSDLNGLTLGSVVRASVRRSRVTYSSGKPALESVVLLAIEALDH